MSKYAELIDKIFCPNGVLGEAINAIGEKYFYRKEQHKAANAICCYIEDNFGKGKEREKVDLLNMNAGGGKTFSLLINAAIFNHVTGKHVVIASSTKALRQQYMRDLGIVNDVLKRLNIPPITMGEYGSSMSIASPSKIKKYAERWEKLEDNKHAMRFAEWFSESFANDPIVYLSDWLIEPNSEGMFPLGTTERNFCLSSKDDPEVLKIFKERMKDSLDNKFQIILVTHVTLIKNSLAWGQILGTKNDEKLNGEFVSADPDTISIGAIIVDEAHKIPESAKMISTNMISINDESTSCMESVFEKYDIKSSLISSLTSDMRDAKRFVIGAAERDKYREIIEQLHDELIIHYKNEKDVIARSELGDILYCIGAMSNRFGKAGTSALIAKQFSQTSMIIEKNIDGTTSFGFAPIGIKHITGSMFRYAGFQPIVMVSGTIHLEGIEDINQYEHFRNVMGIASDDKDRKETPFISDSGKITDIIFAGRKVAVPSLLTEEAGENKSYVNPAFMDYCSNSVATLSDAYPDKRILVLLTSTEAQSLIYDGLVRRNIGNRVVRQNAGQNYKSLLEKYAAIPNGIWLGMNWEGIDLRLKGKTLVDIVVITKIPFLAEHRFNVWAFKDAIIKMRQGIGRGLRSPEDRIKLAILDPRFPLPNDVLGDKRKRLNKFAACVENEGRYKIFDKMVAPSTMDDVLEYSILDEHQSLVKV